MADPAKGAAVLDAMRESRPQALSSYDVLPEVLRIHREGLGSGDRTGWPSVDQHFTVAKSQVTTITGWPNAGKSQWLDALALNLARQGWRFVFCSLENIPVWLHVEKLAAQFVGKPVREGRTPRMDEDELTEAVTEMADWFSFLSPGEKKPNPGMLDVIEAIETSFRERELWGTKDAKLAAAIDPWNELEHLRPSGMSETEYVSECLSTVRQWSRRHGVHVFIVAHPAKQPRNRDTGKLPVATPDMISGSANFWNKSDNCITVALVNEHESDEVDIHVQKIRFRHIGRRGMVTLRFDKVTGRYHERAPKLAEQKQLYADE